MLWCMMIIDSLIRFAFGCGGGHVTDAQGGGIIGGSHSSSSGYTSMEVLLARWTSDLHNGGADFLGRLLF